MFLLTFILIFGALVGLTYLLVFGIGNAIKWQARKPAKRFFAPVPRPGSYCFVTNEGRITDILENVIGWNLKLNETNGRRLFYPERHIPGLLEENLGVRWIGPYSTIKEFKDFEWSEMQEKKVKEDGKDVVRYEIETRKETFTDSFFQFSHPVKTDAIEIRGNYQVVVTMLITVLNLDPERAQFLNKDASILLAAIIQSTVRSHICDRDFDEVKRMAGTATNGQNQELWEAIKGLNGLEMDNGTPRYETEDPLGVFGKLGKYIVRGEIVQVDAVGEAAKAIEAEKIAEFKGNAKIKEAEKEARTAVIAAQSRMDAAELDAIAQRRLLEATAGYFASLPGGSRMYVADRVASKESDIITWVEAGSEIKTTLPLPTPPPIPKPTRVEEKRENNSPQGTQ